METLSYQFELSNGLSATGVRMKKVPTKADAPLTIVLSDGGRQSAATPKWDRVPKVGDRLARGQQVLALELAFFGDAVPDASMTQFAKRMEAGGERPLGLEAAQLIALVSAALEPHLSSEVETWDGMQSLSFLLDNPVSYGGYSGEKGATVELFCLDLYKDFDIDRIALLASPAKVVQQHDQELPSETPKGH